MAINGRIVYLRPMESSDMEAYQVMLNDETISGEVVGWSFPVSRDEQNSWFHQACIDQRNRRFSIVMKETNLLVGMVALSSIDWHNRSATLGIKLLPSCPKQTGIGTDAVMTLEKYAFEQVNLNRLDGSWIEYNIPSERLFEKCGWHKEGEKKEAIFRNGQYHNLIIAGITKTDYLALISKNMLARNG